MATINFPASPTINQEYTFGDRTWIWNGTGWVLFSEGDTTSLNRINHIGTQSISTISGLSSSLGDKVDKVSGKGLSTNDYTTTEKNKLGNIETNSTLLNRSNHSGVQSISTIDGLSASLGNKVDKVSGKGLSTNDYTTTEKNKLANIEVNSTSNATNAQLRDRGTHTGVQPTSSISGLDASLLAKLGVGDAAISLKFKDTRSVTDLPEDLPNGAMSFDFKYNANAGNPPLTASATYSHIISAKGWSDMSGGGMHQLSLGDGIAMRQATSMSEWGPWRTFYHDNNLVAATTSKTGLMSSTDKTKLDNVGSMANRSVTIDTTDPSGGVDGDVWFKVK